MSTRKPRPRPLRNRIGEIAPGIGAFANYRRAYLRSDIAGGLSVAALALPVGIAYADLAGVPTMVGIYSAIFPLFAYAIFGSSRQLIVGPDTATCLIVAASLGPLAAGNPERYTALLSLLTLMTAVVLIAGGIARFGFMANFLSQPILTGYLNGVAILIMVGQIPKLLGITIEADGIFENLGSIVTRLPDSNVATLIVGAAMLLVLFVLKRVARSFPAPLFAVIGGFLVVKLFGLDREGLALLGELRVGTRSPSLPHVDYKMFGGLLADAAGIALVAFTSGVLTAKSFARRNRYRVDANQELIGFGASNIASWLAQGFPVTGANSRTTVNDAVGGKTQAVGVVAGVVMLVGLFFLASSLQEVPLVALAAVVFVAASGLLDLKSLRRLYHMSRREFFFSIATTLGVLTFGVLTGVALAVVLSLLWLLAIMSRPRATALGRVPHLTGFHSVEDHREATTIPGLLIFRFDGNLIFFNAEYFRAAMMRAIANSPDPIEWVVVDASPINIIDATALQSFIELREELDARGIRLATARSKQVLQTYFSAKFGSVQQDKYGEYRFETIAAAIRAFEHRDENPNAEPPPHLSDGASVGDA